MKNLKGPFGEEIVFKNNFPKSLVESPKSFWFVDAFFKNHFAFKGRKNVVFLKASEELKTISVFQKNLKTLMDKNINRSNLIYCVGGGSLGDSIGFLCSVYMRGVKFVMIPTTWLACVDSSVGGKTALNIFGFKNTIGTFYPPEKNLYIKDFIKTSQVKDAEGEILKTLFLNHNKKWAQEMIKKWPVDKIVFEELKRFVNFKSQIVKKDFKDFKGIRVVLNLGHSLGHALELERNLSHSDAVLEGMVFAIEWSRKNRFISIEKANLFSNLIDRTISKVSPVKLKASLLKDKKTDQKRKIDFVFLSDTGALVKKVSIDQVVREYQRQIEHA